jgi:hypothetical protein
MELLTVAAQDLEDYGVQLDGKQMKERECLYSARLLLDTL